MFFFSMWQIHYRFCLFSLVSVLDLVSPPLGSVLVLVGSGFGLGCFDYITNSNLVSSADFAYYLIAITEYWVLF